MKAQGLATLRLAALTFLLPGLAGLVTSAVISTQYLETMPREPTPEQLRLTPRNIHGTIVYQTEGENRDLNLIEYSSVGVFLVGLGLSVVYLERWGSFKARTAPEGTYENLG